MMSEYLARLNEKQMEAVFTDNRNVLILAGAGSGKTRTIISRIIYLLSEKKISPYNILALTFTNKACKEMSNRIYNTLGFVSGLTIKTFHSFGAYLLRREYEAVDRKVTFQIYDDDDSNKLLNELMKSFGVDKSERNSIRRWIATYKQNCEEFPKNPDGLYLNIYKEYNKLLKLSNAFDFEDLIVYPVKIFEGSSLVLEKYASRYKYILVDEYQDTNYSQYKLLKSLAYNSNLMVVGDEDQSIYSFRGADVKNIIGFPDDFDDTQIIRLERNYRSTGTILGASNALIANNKMRLGKTLFTEIGDGDKINVVEIDDERAEADYVVSEILKNAYEPTETAILIRTNAQTRAIEQKFVEKNIPYIIVGYVGFYDREEVKDVIALLKWLANSNDRVAFSRFVNKPVRGIGKKSLEAIFNLADKYNGDILEALAHVDSADISAKNRSVLTNIYELFKDKLKIIEENSLKYTAAYFIEKSGLKDHYILHDIKETTDKTENILEFLGTLDGYESGLDVLLNFLENSMLESSSLAAQGADDNLRYRIMTVHNAKGLEFENVFICGAENSLFPHVNSLDKEEGVEEERRLFYVAMTRAKLRLYIMYANNRTLFGNLRISGKSMFVNEIPEDYYQLINLTQNANMKKNFHYSVGQLVRHKEYGKGVIKSIKECSGKHLSQIDFFDYGTVELILEYSKLEKEYD